MTTPNSTSPTPRTIAVTGASGFVGRRLVPLLVARGHEVVAMSRSPRADGGERVRWVVYDPMDAGSATAAVDGCDTIVHLAGDGIADGRWTDAKMVRIRDSRVAATAALVAGIAACESRPKALVSASAVGFYGPREPQEALDETSAHGDDFLAGVCRAWESEASAAKALGLRVTIVRTGIVLGRGGGALAKMVTPMKLFVGGPIGHGRQMMSWIHIDDLCALYLACVEDDGWRGPVNGTAPTPVPNHEFAKALGSVLHRPSFLPTPGFALRILLGKVVQILTTGQRVLPKVALARGFCFRFPDLAGALTDLLSGDDAAS